MSMLELDPLAIVNQQPKQDEQVVPSPNMSAPAQSGVNGVNTTGMLSTQTPTVNEYSSPFDVGMSAQQATTSTVVQPQSNNTLTKAEFITQATKDIDEVGRVRPSTLEGINYQYNPLQTGKGSASEVELDRARQYSEWAQATGAYSEGTDVDAIVEDIMYTQLSSVKEGTAMDAMDVVVPLATMALTAGLGGAISTAWGVSSATGAGIAAGGVSLAQGDSLDEALVKGFTAGLGEAANSANQALTAAQQAGETAEVIKGLQATAEVTNNIKNVVNIGQAIESGNILKGINAGLGLAGIPTLEEIATDGILKFNPDSEFLIENADNLAGAALNVAEGLAQGESIDKALLGGINKYIRSGGNLNGLVPEGGDFSFDFDLEMPAWLQSVAETASDINKNYVKPAIEQVDQLVRELPTTKEDWQEAEDYVNEKIIDPISNTVRETGREIREDVAPVTEAVRETGRDVRETASELNEEYVKPVAEAAGEVVDKVKDYGDEFGDLANNLIKGMLGGLAASGSSQRSPQQARQGSVPSNQFLKPELVRGFDLDQPFVNPLLRG